MLITSIIILSFTIALIGGSILINKNKINKGNREIDALKHQLENLKKPKESKEVSEKSEEETKESDTHCTVKKASFKNVGIFNGTKGMQKSY